jgi:murein DD-endopeptidase MepM/ murein hydrolase activator NlpD
MFDHAPSRNEDFFCWAKPVLCPGDGTVASMANDLPDNAFNTPAPFDVEAHIRNPEQEIMKHSGNHLLIDHGSNEYSLLAHMQQGSVQAKLGDRAAKEQ